MARPKEAFTASEIVIEVDPVSKPSRIGSRRPPTAKNNYLLFKPLGIVLRGRWDNSRIQADYDYESPYRFMPIVPGMYICLDVKARTLRAVDPLSFDENAELLSQVQASAHKDQGEVGPSPESRLDRLGDTEIKTALWEMYQHLEEKHCRLVRGEMPRRDEILALPGQLILRRSEAGRTRDYDPEFDLNKPMPPWATERELKRMGAPEPQKAA